MTVKAARYTNMLTLLQPELARFHDPVCFHVYQTRPATLDNLKANIRQEIQRVPQDMLQHMFQDIPKRLQEWITEEGGHLFHPIFKK
ncbi:hypothetical protein ANN_21246 [Periplaneta americana]|uniref:Uncharacterized protein n=1 Tax=Periplaneta americana TaxID=6978 RepID=A0ABQ8SF89_PERAM|nr:hypothetical protein ANN_21246 [Periplaneta americana]